MSKMKRNPCSFPTGSENFGYFGSGMSVNCCVESYFSAQTRWMTAHRRVQDRSRLKRVHSLEDATEKWKIVSKVLQIMEILKKEPEQVIQMKFLDQHRSQINLPKPHKMSDFLKKSPKLFELYRDKKGGLWCGLTIEAEDLIQEEMRILEEHSDKAAEYVTRMLMMSIDKRLPLDKIAHFRRDFGLPSDFRTTWLRRYPQHFRVVISEDDVEYLELVSWNPDLAVTELEKKTIGDIETGSNPCPPGLLSLPFPLKFPSTYRKGILAKYMEKIEQFQKRAYLSPYADARGLKPGSQEFDKRAVAIMHELLSFTIEKRLVTDHLTHFRREFMMPQKLMRLLLKHFGIFYVSEKGKRFSVFLTEAYKGSELIEKCPLVLWKEKVRSLTGYRAKKEKVETFSDFSDTEDDDLFDSDFENKKICLGDEQEEIMQGLEDMSQTDCDEMNISDIQNVYEDIGKY